MAQTSPSRTAIFSLICKQFAGRQVWVEAQEAGVWLVRTATLIPDNERWLHEAQPASELARAMAWSKQHPAADDQTDALLGAADNTV